VRGTPTLFVNGNIYRGPITVDDLTEALASTAPEPVSPPA
jgi:protein-disulfide isomerase